MKNTNNNKKKGIPIGGFGFDLGQLREPIKETIEPPPADGLILPGVHTSLDIERVKSISYRFKVGYADRIGLRDSMEDKIVICGNFRNKPDEDYFAIFDGHAGKEASAYCAEYMHLFLESQLNEKQGDIPHCITQTFKITHERMRTQKTEEGNYIESGTTSLIALFCGNDLFIANAGDSRAVFCQNKSSILVTEDHKPSSDREMKRIKSLPGGMVIKNRVQGKLAVSRAIGDYKLNPYVTEIPDVFGPFNWRDPTYEFLILACDGLWDVMGEQKACDFVRRCRDPREAAVKLRDWAYDERSKDNISVVVIWFPDFVPDEPLIEEPKQKPKVQAPLLSSRSLLQRRDTRLELETKINGEKDDQEEDDSEDEDEEDDESEDEGDEENDNDEDYNEENNEDSSDEDNNAENKEKEVKEDKEEKEDQKEDNQDNRDNQDKKHDEENGDRKNNALIK